MSGETCIDKLFFGISAWLTIAFSVSTKFVKMFGSLSEIQALRIDWSKLVSSSEHAFGSHSQVFSPATTTASAITYLHPTDIAPSSGSKW